MNTLAFRLLGHGRTVAEINGPNAAPRLPKQITGADVETGGMRAMGSNRGIRATAGAMVAGRFVIRRKVRAASDTMEVHNDNENLSGDRAGAP